MTFTAGILVGIVYVPQSYFCEINSNAMHKTTLRLGARIYCAIRGRRAWIKKLRLDGLFRLRSVSVTAFLHITIINVETITQVRNLRNFVCECNTKRLFSTYSLYLVTTLFFLFVSDKIKFYSKPSIINIVQLFVAITASWHLTTFLTSRMIVIEIMKKKSSVLNFLKVSIKL
jgi:hypothetical protein